MQSHAGFLESMKEHYKDEPHSPLMKMDSDFIVAFFGDESLKKASLRVSRLIEFGASPRRRHP